MSNEAAFAAFWQREFPDLQCPPVPRQLDELGLTQQMAMIDNYGVFKHLKDPTREHTLYLVYRAERLQAAFGDAQKIFKLLCVTIYDGAAV